MAFSEQDKKVLQSIPGKTKIVKEEKSPEHTAHIVETTDTQGVKHRIRANSIKEYIEGLDKRAKDFDKNNATVKAIEELRNSPQAQLLNKKTEEAKDDIKSILSKIHQDLKIRGEVLRAYLNADPKLMYQKIDELRKFEGVPTDPDE
ncbi:MAG: hypothetical protein LUC43_09935 [Burkholderiales bacterium]|nr:hypothetical protein [Burkholderiales bacterium]